MALNNVKGAFKGPQGSPVPKKKEGPRTIIDGIDYYIKYLGKAPTDKVHGVGSTEAAVDIIRQQAKESKIMHKVKVTISTKSIKVTDHPTEVALFETPLYRVSYCTVDQTNNKICCYIVRESGCKEMNVHAFYCGKKSKAEALTLTVAEAFNIAYADWQAKKLLANNQDDATSKEPDPVDDSDESTEMEAGPLDVSQQGRKRELSQVLEEPQKGAASLNTRLESCEEIPETNPVSMASMGLDDVFGGGEMKISDFSAEVQAFLRGEVSAEDLVRARSVDDLLDL